MSLQVFDRINSVNSPKLRSMDIKKYFSEMQLSNTQKKERIALAEELEDVMLFFFSLVLLIDEFSYMQAISTVDAKQQLKDRVYGVVEKYTQITDEVREFLDEFVDEVNDTTTEHLVVLLALMRNRESADSEKRKSEEFYLSDDRARLLGEEESNTIFNAVDFAKAKKLGYKYKTWITMRDNRVRHTHALVDDRTIPIDDLFLVGNSYMRFCRDDYYGASPREIIGCRCSIRYSK